MTQNGYIRESDDGWVNAKFSNGEIKALPQYLRVELVKLYEGDSRDYFIIKEGVFKSEKASINNSGGSYVKKGLPPRTSSREMVFFRTKEILEITGLGTFNAITEPSTPVPLGKHDIKIPDHPHASGSSYVDRAKYARTWFSLGNFSGVGDVYLHCGSRSLGCVTVTDIEKWDLIYNYLIKARLGHSNAVGTITIKK
ncbi:MAG: hypothetical protein ACPGTO_03900 [Polaribacter sp.]